MKLTALAVAALLPLVALSAPMPDDDIQATGVDATPGTDEPAHLEKRAIVGTVDADALKYRRCPRTSCDAVGQYSRGTRVTMNCFTTYQTTNVNGDNRWAKLANGYYVALYYMNWPGSLPRC